MIKKKKPPWILYKIINLVIRFLERVLFRITPPMFYAMRISSGHSQTQFLHAALELNIFEELNDNPVSIEQLAGQLDVNKNALQRFMRPLCSLKLVKKNRKSEYIITPHGSFFRQKSSSYLYSLTKIVSEVYLETFNYLPASIKNGRKVLPEYFGTNMFEYFKENQAYGKLFAESMITLTQSCLLAILAEYDFSAYNKVCDIGGGVGTLLFSILDKYPGIKGILFDLPETVIKTKKKFTDRCEYRSGSFFESIPENCDLYILKFIIHDWNDQKALKILQNCRNSMNQNSKLLLMELIIDDNKDDFMKNYMDLIMFSAFDGKERTIKEFNTLLNKADLKLNRIIRTRSFMNIIEVERK